MPSYELEVNENDGNVTRKIISSSDWYEVGDVFEDEGRALRIWQTEDASPPCDQRLICDLYDWETFIAETGGPFIAETDGQGIALNVIPEEVALDVTVEEVALNVTPGGGETNPEQGREALHLGEADRSLAGGQGQLPLSRLRWRFI